MNEIKDLIKNELTKKENVELAIRKLDFDNIEICLIAVLTNKVKLKIVPTRYKKVVIEILKKIIER